MVSQTLRCRKSVMACLWTTTLHCKSYLCCRAFVRHGQKVFKEYNVRCGRYKILNRKLRKNELGESRTLHSTRIQISCFFLFVRGLWVVQPNGTGFTAYEQTEDTRIQITSWKKCKYYNATDFAHFTSNQMEPFMNVGWMVIPWNPGEELEFSFLASCNAQLKLWVRRIELWAIFSDSFLIWVLCLLQPERQLPPQKIMVGTFFSLMRAE